MPALTLVPISPGALFLGSLVATGAAYNVKDYGAIGNNVADDAPAIQAAINAANAAGGAIVFFPPGTYKTTAVLSLPANVQLVGSGGADSVISANVTTADPNTGNKSAINLGRGANHVISNLKINGNSTTQVGIEISGYNDGQIQRPTIRDCIITGCTVAGIKIQGGYRGVFVNNEILSNAVGIWVPLPASLYNSATGQYDFIANWVHDNTAEGVLIQGGGLYNFYGGNVENNGTYGFHFNNSTSELAPILLSGVDIEQNGNYTTGIGLIAKANTRNLVVEGCQFFGSSANGTQAKSWQLDSGANSCVFVGNFQQGHSIKATNAGSSNTIIPGKFTGASEGIASNYLALFSAAAGTSPNVTAAGGDTNIDVIVRGQGTGAVYLGDNQANYVRATGSAAGSLGAGSGYSQILATGSDTNVHLFLTVKGAGGILLGSNAFNNITALPAATGSPVELSAATNSGDTNVDFKLTPRGTGKVWVNGDLKHTGTNAGFFSATPTSKPTVTGSRGANAALASLLTQLASLGLITDSTTA